VPKSVLLVMMKLLTVFTPTYNRAYCLKQCYNSLINQTNKAFIWLIIDDGSTDNTKELVQTWINSNIINIQYQFQENQGMHGAHNKAYDLIKTELNVCIDSDDFMPDDAVDNIISFWNTLENKKNIAGLIGLDAYKDRTIIGQKYPVDLKKSTLEDLYHKHHIPGDKKIVYRTEVVNKYPRYPLFEKERFVPLGVLYLAIDKDYELMCLNEVLCIVEYMEDGSSRNILKQYKRHPKGFKYARVHNMNYSKYFKVIFKNAIHYVSHCIFLKQWKDIFKSPKPLLTLLAVPFGIILYVYIHVKTKEAK